MATVYSLVCWGGSAGKSVTGATATDIITLTNHGLRTGTGVVPQSTVSGVTSGTTYYAYAIPGSNSTFYLYNTYANSLLGGVTGRVDITATTAFILKSAYYLALSDKSRWTTGGVERIYDGLAAWRTARSAATTLVDSEIAELGMAFLETVTSAINVNMACGYAEVTSYVNGQRSSAFHNGVLDSGYLISCAASYTSCISMAVLGGVMDGFSVRNTANESAAGASLSNTGVEIRNLIAIGGSASFANCNGFQVYANYTRLTNCLSTTWGRGIFTNDYRGLFTIANCLATKCGTGFAGVTYTSTAGTYLNNIAYGNTTNWQSTVYGFTYADRNAGGTGEAWMTTGRTRIELTDGSPFSAVFADWTNNNFRPAAVASPLVEGGSEYFRESGTDIADTKRPSYPGSLYNTAVTAGSFVTGLSYTIASVGTTDFTAIGASANTIGVTFKATGAGSGTGTATLNAKLDIGAYEFDLGYGAWPATATISLTNIVNGSRVLITKASDGSVLYNDVPGTSLSHSTSHIGDFNVVIRKASASPFYREFAASGTTVANQTTSIKCLQQLDE